MTTNFDYYYGREADQYTFLRIPKTLLNDLRFDSLSLHAKVLYGLMLDRMSLSAKNNWLDEQQRVYIYYTLNDAKENMRCGKDKAVALFAELEKIGLIERKKQGLGKPAVVYVKNFITKVAANVAEKSKAGILESKSSDVEASANNTSDAEKTNSFSAEQVCPAELESLNLNLPSSGIQTSEKSKSEFCEDNSDSTGNLKQQSYEKVKLVLSEIRTQDFRKTEVLSSEKPNSGLLENRTQDFGKTDSNNTDINNNYINNTQSVMSCQSNPAEEKNCQNIRYLIDTYTELIKHNISYSDFKISKPHDLLFVDEIVTIMLDVIVTNSGSVRINGEQKPGELVKEMLLKLKHENICFVVERFKSQTNKISNKRQYILTMLYNSTMELDAHYTNLVNHDLGIYV